MSIIDTRMPKYIYNTFLPDITIVSFVSNVNTVRYATAPNALRTEGIFSHVCAQSSFCIHTTRVTERSVSELKLISANTKRLAGEMFVQFAKPKSLYSHLGFESR
jgi:hypothetical protein